MNLTKLKQSWIRKKCNHILLIMGCMIMILISVACSKTNNENNQIIVTPSGEQENQVTDISDNMDKKQQSQSDTSEYEDDISSSYGDLTVSLREDSVTSSGLALVFHNSGDKEYHYGSYYQLDRKEDGVWVRLPYEFEGGGEIGWTEEAYPVMKDKDSIWEVNWEWLYGILTPGEYRIVKNGNDFRKTGDFDSFYVGVIFEIK